MSILVYDKTGRLVGHWTQFLAKQLLNSGLVPNSSENTYEVEQDPKPSTMTEDN